MTSTLYRADAERPVVSGHVYARLFQSKALRQLVLPEGFFPSPYVVLEYDATLTLDGRRGIRATFARRQTIRFQQDQVGALLDHAWGDGVLLTDYRTDAGELLDSLRGDGRYHFVVALARRMDRGETLTFNVRRTTLATFLNQEEWLETTIDHPVRRLRRRIIFPLDRPCKAAALHVAGRVLTLPMEQLADGRTVVTADIPHPIAHLAYTVRWRW